MKIPPNTWVAVRSIPGKPIQSVHLPVEPALLIRVWRVAEEMQDAEDWNDADAFVVARNKLRGILRHTAAVKVKADRVRSIRMNHARNIMPPQAVRVRIK